MMLGSIETQFDIHLELRLPGGEGAAPMVRRCVTDDVADLAEEALIGGMLSEKLPIDGDGVRVAVEPVWAAPPAIRGLEVAVTVTEGGREHTYRRRCSAERWDRTAVAQRQDLIRQGRLAEDAVAHSAVVAVPRHQPLSMKLPPLSAPRIVDGGLEPWGIRRHGDDGLDADRPVLIHLGLLADILQRTINAGCNETGGAVLGKLVRLPRPMPGTNTRIVTLFSAGVADDRHVGAPGVLRFNPQALAEAALLCQRRAQDEAVLTVWHSHGWSAKCGHCQKRDCPLPHVGQVSLDDYQVFESLFSSKAALMPIVGRLPGASGRLPAMILYRWRGGVMRPAGWQIYE